MALEVARPRPNRSRPTARRACRRRPGCRPEARARRPRRRVSGADHVGRARQVGQLRAVDAGEREQLGRRSAMRDGSRLSVSQCRTIESYVATARPVSLRFSQSFGSRYFHVARGDVGALGLQPEDVRDRVLARVRGRAAREADPRAQLPRVVALRPSPARRRASRSASAPRESIQMIASCSGSPSASTATVPDHCDVTDDRDDVVDRRRVARSQQPARAATMPVPPVGRALLERRRRRELQVDGLELAVDELAVEGEQRDLRARRAEVDREDVLGHGSAPVTRRGGAGRGRRSRPADGRGRGSGRGCCACCRRRSART